MGAASALRSLTVLPPVGLSMIIDANAVKNRGMSA
jgi:hypothetical protein